MGPRVWAQYCALLKLSSSMLRKSLPPCASGGASMHSEATSSRHRVASESAERHEISATNPEIVKSLLKRLMQVSETGTQGAYMCAEEAAADGKALHEQLNRTGAFLPYIDSQGNLSFPWLNDVDSAPVCYNP